MTRTVYEVYVDISSDNIEYRKFTLELMKIEFMMKSTKKDKNEIQLKIWEIFSGTLVSLVPEIEFPVKFRPLVESIGPKTRANFNPEFKDI